MLRASNTCYDGTVSQVASRQLRNDTRALLQRVEAGEDIVITVAGRPVAVLRPLARRSRWMSSGEFLSRFMVRQADSGLTDELRQLAPDSTDDLP